MVLVWLSIVLGAFTSLAYYWQPDWLTAFTIWPAWFWFSAGVALALAGYSRPTRKLILSAALLWGGVGYLLRAEAVAVLRSRAWPVSKWEDARRQGAGLRVVTLNCAGGSLAAAQEAGAYHADIVLLQEVPTRGRLTPLIPQLTVRSAESALGMDTAVIAAGAVEAIPVNSPLLQLARVRLFTGQSLVVGSVRLPPPSIRTDLWSPEIGRAHV